MTLRLTRFRLPESALNLTRLARDLSLVRDNLTSRTASFETAWPEEVAGITSGLVAAIADLDAAIAAADGTMGVASGVANVTVGGTGSALAAAFRRFKLLSDELPVLVDMRNLLFRMLTNIANSVTDYSDSEFPIVTQSAVNPTRPGPNIYDLAT